MWHKSLNVLVSLALISSCSDANAIGIFVPAYTSPMPVHVSPNNAAGLGTPPAGTPPAGTPRQGWSTPWTPPANMHKNQQPSEVQPANQQPLIEPASVKKVNQHPKSTGHKVVPKDMGRSKPAVGNKQTEKPAAANNQVLAPEVSAVAQDQSASRSFTDVRLFSESVKVEINDHVAKTAITEIFKNDSDHLVSGSYLFPLPKDAVFNAFSLWIDGKPVQAKVLDSKEARRQYETIVRLMVDPGLLEYVDYKTVRASFFPIPAHGTKEIQLQYTQTLASQNGFIKYEFPLQANGQAPIDRVHFSAQLENTQPIKSVLCPAYKTRISRVDDRHLTMDYDGERVIPANNFSLMYSLSDKPLAADVTVEKDQLRDGYFLMTLMPPMNSEAVSKDILLIADTSGSMIGTKIQQLKSALKKIVDSLPSSDRFNLICFNSDVNSFMPNMVLANDKNKSEAKTFVDAIQAKGGTDIYSALSKGALMLRESDRTAYIILTTDGTPTAGKTDTSDIVSALPSTSQIRVFDIGIGDTVNSTLLDRLASVHHGKSQYVADNNLELVLTSLYDQIKKPALTDVTVAFDGIQTKDVYPNAAFDIFAGEQAVLLGKYAGGGEANVRVSGKINGQTKTFSFPLVFAKSANATGELSRLWAMRRIAYLSQLIDSEDNNKPYVEEVISLSKEYGIVSPYASMLVTDPKGLRIGESRASVFMDSSNLESSLEAIRRSKMLTSYSSSACTADQGAANRSVRVVASKTFYLRGDVWTDASYDPANSAKVESIEFGTPRYFDLVNSDEQLAKYFSVGAKLIVVSGDKVYKIIQGELAKQQNI